MNVFITGTNSGIGLEFVKQYAPDSYKLFATYYPHGPLEELQSLAYRHNNIVLLPLDVTDENQLSILANQLKTEPIDILINNAGIFGRDQELATITKEMMINVFTVNAVGPLLVTKYFLNNVIKSNLKTIVSISSRMGSISYILKEHASIEDAYAYRASKAALNSIMASIAIDTYDQNVKVLLLHPGHVRTAMGGPHAEIDTTTSVLGMKKVIINAPRSLEQLFYRYDGTLMHW